MGAKPKQISASRSSAILGLNPYRTEAEVWQEMMEEQYPGYNAEHNLKMPEQKDNPAMRWGLAFEDAICELAEKAYSVCHNYMPYTIARREDFFKKKKIITCHIDGVLEMTKGIPAQIKTLHEGKTTSYFYWKDNFGEPGTDRIPIVYQSQAQHQLICTGAEEVIPSVLIFPRRVEEWEKIGWQVIYNDPTNKFVTWTIDGYVIINKNNNYKMISPSQWAITLDQMGYFQQYSVKKNIEVQQSMVAFYQWWWQKHIVEKKQPEASNYDDIRRLWTEPCGTIVASEQFERWCKEYRDLGVELGSTGEMAKRRERLKVMILDEMRKSDNMIDDDSRDKTILRDRGGNKLLSFNGKVLR